MYLVQILLPLFDNEGRRFHRDEYVRIHHDLAEQFGGVTSYMRAPAHGIWKGGSGETARDDIAIFEVMTARLELDWWSRFREEMETRFRQDHVVVRAIATTML